MSEKGPRLKKQRGIVALSLLNKVETGIFKSEDICLIPTHFSHAVQQGALFQSWRPLRFPHVVFALKRVVLFSFFFVVVFSVQFLHPSGPIPFLHLLYNQVEEDVFYLNQNSATL